MHMHDATRNRPHELRHVRCSASEPRIACSRPRTNPNARAGRPKQGRYDFNRFLLRLSSHAITWRGAAKREEIDVPMYPK
jgi:hypothetical protein